MDGRRFLLAIGVVAFVIIVSIAIFSVDWSDGEGPITDRSRDINMTDLAGTDTQVRMTIRGFINNNQEHEQLRMTVGNTGAIGELMSGYQGGVVRVEQTGNNTESYKAFLSALYNSGYLKTKAPVKNIQYDGACPTGLRYTFEFIGSAENLPKPLWASSCGKKDGNFAGETSTVRNLFYRQLPKEQFQALTDDSQF